MIRLKDLIPNNIHDPFTGEIHEGLIQTIEINKALDIIKKQFKGLQEFSAFDNGLGSIIVEFRPKYTEDKIKNYIGNFPDPNISKILVLLNNLGYFPSVIQYRLNNSNQKPKSSLFPTLNKDVQQYSMKYNSSKFRDLVKDEEPTLLIFDFESKYDPTVIPPQFIYHITDSKYVDNIKKIGLKPKSLNKRSTHTERIYFSLDENKSKALWNKLKYDLSKGKGVLLTIDTENLTNTFYNDPNFSGKGIYTYENIPPQNIIKYEPIIEN